MKLLVLSKYSRKGASSRYREFQYYPYLEANGVSIITSPLFDDDYLDRLYTGKSRLFSVAKAYVRRAFFLLSTPECDVVWVEKELFPWLPWGIEKWFFKILNRPYAVDYDDAIFHQYDKHRFSLVRKLLATKCDRVMNEAQAVIAGNAYLASRARQAGATNIVEVPTVVSGQIFSPKESENSTPVIGWIGSMSTAIYLEEIHPVLLELSKKYAFRFRVVGAQINWKDLPVENIPWSEADEVSLVQGFDIGIMPLVDSFWERGKCGFKLIQYMACGKAVVADPVGVNAQIVEDGQNGFLSTKDRSWFEALELLLNDSALRTSMGKHGRQRFENEYSLERWQHPVYELLKSIAAKGKQS